METKDTKSGAGDFDSSVQIASPGIKYFVFGVLFLTLMVLLWSIFGKIPVKIQGKGIIVSNTYDKSILSDYQGIIRDIYKKSGDTVHTGDQLMMLEQFELTLQTQQRIFEIHRSIKEDSMKLMSLENERILQLQNFGIRKQKLKELIKSFKERIKFYEKLFLEKKDLTEKGIISQTELKQAQFNLENEKLGLIDAQSKLSTVIYEEDAYLKNFTMQLLEVSDRMEDMAKQKQTMLLRNDKYSYIISPYDGIIQEVLTHNENPVEVGEKLFTINPLNINTKQLEISFFIPFNNQQQAAKGMEIVVAPFNVDKNRYGQITGQLAKINSYPSTNEFIAKIADNEDFVRMVTENGPVYFARGKLLTDSSTISGLKWTSFEGAPYKINPGIICDVNIYVDYIRPVSFVIPWIKKTLNDENNQ